MSYASCRGCGRKILWAKDTATGKAIPLDTTPPIYMVTQDAENNLSSVRANQNFNTGEPMFYVSHFTTCPKANDFSHGRRDAGQKEIIDHKVEAAGE
jgi:hypothetical protein